MDYKKNIFYIIGSAMTALSALDLVVTFAMMGMGFDSAIIWFFIGCVTLVIGILMAQSAKRKCEEGYYEFKRPSKLAILKEAFSAFFSFLFKRGFVGAVTLVLLVGSIVVTAIFGFKCAATSFKRGGALNAGYNHNISEAERYKILMEEELENGNQLRADNFKASMEKALLDSQEYLRVGEKLTVQLENQLVNLYYALAADAALVALYISVAVLNKRNQTEG